MVTGKRTFNATFDNGTMRNPFTNEASTSINEDEYVLPQTHFLDIETLKDVTLTELQYVIGNILRSSRYGAISSRLGKVDNQIVAVAFSDCELFSNLELTQAVYDRLKRGGNPDLDFPLADDAVRQATTIEAERLMSSVFSRKPVLLSGAELQTELDGVAAMYYEPDRIAAALRSLSESYK